MNVLLKPSPKSLTHRKKRQKALRTKTQLRVSLDPGHAAFEEWTFYFFLDTKGPHETCSQGSSGQWQGSSSPANPWSCLSPRPLFSLTSTFSQWADSSPALVRSFLRTFLGSQSRAPPGLSCCFYPKSFICFTVPSFNECPLKITWARVVKSFLYKVWTHTLWAGLRQTCFRLVPIW